MKEVFKAFGFHCEINGGHFVQNLLIRQYQFPLHYKETDDLFSTFTNRMEEEQLKVVWPNPKLILEQQLEALPEDQFYLYGKNVASILGFDQKKEREPLTGLRIVRYTNSSNGAPYYRLDFFYTAEPEGRKLFNGFKGDNVVYWNSNMLF